MKKPKNRTARAFTLAEVVVSIAIVGIALLYFAAISTENMERAGEAYQKRLYRSLAQDKLEQYLVEVKNLDEDEANPETSGDFEFAPGYSWTITEDGEFEVPFEEDDEYEEEEEEEGKGYTRFLVRISLRIFFTPKDEEQKELYTLSTMYQKVVEDEE